LLAALVVAVGAIARQAWSADPDGLPLTATAPIPGSTNAADWLTVVTELDTARAAALSNADPSLLDQVYTSSAAPRAADTAVIADLAAKGLRVRDGTHQIAGVTLIRTAGSGTGGSAIAGSGTARPATASGPSGTGAVAGGPDGPGSAMVQVEVVDALPSYPIVDQAGSTVGRTAARPQERRVLVLASTGQGYRIDAIRSG